MKDSTFMMILETTWQASEWLVFLAGSVALYVAITWPAVKGKWWLVVSLSLILLPDAQFCLQPYFIDQMKIDEAGRVLLGPEEYQLFWMFSMIVGYLYLSGKLLFLVAVFRLRSQFRIFLERISTENDAR